MSKYLFRMIERGLIGRPTLFRHVVGHIGGRSIVLCYHNVIQHSDVGDRLDSSLHIPLRKFESHLDALVRCGVTFVSLAEIMRDNEGRGVRVAITFDDAYFGALKHGIPAALARGAPATMCVAPGILGRQTMWWDALGVGSGGGLSHAERERLLTEFSGDHEAIAAKHLGVYSSASGRERIATHSELSEATAGNQLLTIASHSWSHPNLAVLSRRRIFDELSRSRGWLKENFLGAYVDAIAFPYGRLPENASELVAEAGYRYGLSLEARWLTHRSTGRLVPRINVPAAMSAATLVRKLLFLKS